MRGYRKFFWIVAVLMVAGILAEGLMRLAATDYSARQNEHRRKLGAVYMTLNNPFYEIIDEEIRAVVENRGDVLISRDPALSVERQIAEVKELIEGGVEIIFINPVDWKKMEPALQAALDAGIPVIAIDTNVQEEGLVACTVVSDNYRAGVQCAEHLVAHSTGGGVALLKHTEARSAYDRIQGFRDALKSHPEFVIMDEAECLGQLELAMPAMEEMLARHPDIGIVMALNDPAAMGALAALENAGRLDSVKVYGVDGVPETKEMIAAGHMEATAEQSPRLIGRIAAEQAYRILDGHTVDEAHIVLATRLLTRENISRESIERWE